MFVFILEPYFGASRFFACFNFLFTFKLSFSDVLQEKLVFRQCLTLKTVVTFNFYVHNCSCVNAKMFGELAKHK